MLLIYENVNLYFRKTKLIGALRQIDKTGSLPAKTMCARLTGALAVYGEPAVTMALMRDGKIFDIYNCFSQACGVGESDFRADD
jgi:hypothetical protein